MIIDPQNPIYHQACNEKLQAFLLFGILVAGKPADRTAKVVNQLLDMYGASSPFRKLKYLNDTELLEQSLRYVGTGKYRLYKKSIRYILEHHIDDDLHRITLDELEAIPGVGLKTARYFKLYSDPLFEGIPLDTHLLSFLKDCGLKNVPNTTPSSKIRYKKLEDELLILYYKSDFDMVYKFDLAIWRAYSSKNSDMIKIVNKFSGIYDE